MRYKTKEIQCLNEMEQTIQCLNKIGQTSVFK